MRPQPCVCVRACMFVWRMRDAVRGGGGLRAAPGSPVFGSALPRDVSCRILVAAGSAACLFAVVPCAATQTQTECLLSCGSEASALMTPCT